MNTEAAPKRHRHRHGRRTRCTPWYKAWYAKTSPARLAVTALLLVVLCGLSVHAGSLGLAHLQVIRVENDLMRWQQSGKVSSPEAMQNALTAIDRAIALHQDNPYQLSLKGRLLEWRAFSTGGDAAAADYGAALDLYRRAAALRPLWPDSIAEMINVKLNLQQLDGELGGLMERADRLGPYTPAVHAAIVRAAFASGQHDSPLLQRHLLRGLQDHRSRGQMQELTQQYRQESTACDLLAQAPEPKPSLSFCDNQGLSTNN
ncbi:hypothetical protein [Microbulbifer marinus]|uniref:Tetratricopeptide repeat-containing protein n=1 Tax=Microbulbifer marinus TaxID=658218 RepID=A0A1H4ACL6_9GAMM|nr:hypothetical protein [Microbulbifer marinus]SEA33843.1 hypothetical protein SAMN05216562_2701 [Microbulbifer marinus]